MSELERLKKYSLDNPNAYYYLYYATVNGVKEWGITTVGINIPLDDNTTAFEVSHICKNGEIIL